MRVEVSEYDPGWPRAFDEIRVELAAALDEVEIVAIEHVGSTSVPGLAAKPIIDVDIVVESERHVAEASRALETAGYQPNGDLGVAERYAFTAPPHGPRRNVYVTIDGCLSLRNHLGVRDVLRANADLRDRYGALKLRLAERDFEGIDRYVADKSDLLQEVLAQAGLSRQERDTIAEVNR